MPAGSLGISCALAVFDRGKPHAMGVGAHGVRKIEILSTVKRERPLRHPRFPVGNGLILRWRAGVCLGRALTVPRADAMALRLSRPKFGGFREEDLSAPPQEPQTHARISQADADARRA